MKDMLKYMLAGALVAGVIKVALTRATNEVMAEVEEAVNNPQYEFPQEFAIPTVTWEDGYMIMENAPESQMQEDPVYTE